MKKNILFLAVLLFTGLKTANAWTTPVVVSPATNSNGWVGQMFDWSAVASSAAYQIEIDTVSGFTSPVRQRITKTYINTSSSNTDTQHNFSNLYFGKNYYWRVRAYITNDTSAWSTAWVFQTRDYVTMTSPATTSSQWIGLTLDWATHAGVSFYDMQCDTTPLFNSGALRNSTDAYINSSSSNTDTDEYLSGLYFGKTYYWRVRARNSVDTTTWSTPWTFVTRDYVTLLSPATSSSQWTALVLDWASHPGVSFYDMQCDTTPLFNSGALRSSTDAYINSVSTNTDTDEYLSGLYFGKTYYWRVRARSTADTTAWTTPWTFITRDYVTLLSPATTSSQWTGLVLDWSSHPGVSFYDMQCDTTPLFNSSVLRSVTDAYINSVSTNTDTDEYLTGLYFGKTYYWRVRARNAVDTTAWTTPWTFVTRDYVTLSSPATTSSQWTGLVLDWASHPGVSFYDMQCDTTPSFNSGALRSVTDAYINSVSTNTDTDEYLTGLYFGKTYYWRVRARNAVDTTAWTTPWTFVTRDYVTLSSPATTSSQWTGLVLDWASHPGVSFYDMQCDTTPSFNSGALRSVTDAYINSVSTNTDTDEYLTGLYFGKTYYWRVRARNAVDTTAWTTPWTFVTRDYVTLSSPATASSQWTGLTLDWSAHPGVSYYDLQCDTTPLFNSAALRSNTDLYINSNSSNTDTDEYLSGLYFGKTYYWRVRARNAVDTTAWTTPWTFVTRDYVSLSSPANAQLNVSTAGVTLDWLSHSGVSYYQVQWDSINTYNSPVFQQANNAYINSNNSNSDTQRGTGALLANRVYFWRVRAWNAVDTSEWTERWFSTGTVQPVIPGVPVHVAPANYATSQPVTVLLDWNASANAQSYDYQYATNSSFTGAVTANTTATSATISGLAQSSYYYWRVRAVNGNIVSAWTSYWQFTTTGPLSAPVLISPANLTTGVPVSGVSLVWNSVPNATQYEYEYSTDPTFTSGVQAGTSAVTSASTGTLATLTTYYWRIRATDGVTFSPWSASWSFETVLQLAAPSLISPANLTTGVVVGGVQLTWNTVANATQYEYEYSTSPSFSSGVVSGLVASPNAMTGILNTYTIYYWHIRAVNGSVYSPWSSTWSFETELQLAAPSLISPANLSTGITPTGALLTWSTVANATGYEYEYTTDPSFMSGVVNGTTGSTNTTTGTLLNLTTYYWRVRGYNGTVYSPWSGVWYFTTDNSTGISEIQANSLQLFPVPATDVLHVRNTSEITTVRLYDLSGNMVLALPGNGTTSLQLDVAALAAGTYIIEVQNNPGMYRGRVTVIH